MEFLQQTVWALWDILVEAGIWLLAGFFAAGLLHVLVRRSWIEKQLTGRAGVWKASLLGAPIPLCSCSVIPFAAGVRRQGASKGSSASFAISSPEIDLPAMGLTWALLGPVMAIVRPISALLSALTAGVLIDQFGDKKTVALQVEQPSPQESGCCSSKPAPTPCCESEASSSCCSDAPKPVSSCCSSEPAPAASCCASGQQAEQSKWLRATRFSLLTLPKDLGIWMGVGLIISAIILAAIPPGWIEANLTGGQFGAWASRGLMLLIGIPLYVCATASTPLVAALLAAGLSPGAGLIFLLAGPATNPATMAWVLKDLGVRALIIYLLVIGSVAFGAGTLVDLAMPGGWFSVADVVQAHTHAGLLHQLAGGLLALLLAVGIIRKVAGWSRLGSPRTAKGPVALSNRPQRIAGWIRPVQREIGWFSRIWDTAPCSASLRDCGTRGRTGWST